MLKYMVKTPNRPDPKQLVKWCDNNLDHRYTVFLGWEWCEWKFESHQEAVWFALRWGTYG